MSQTELMAKMLKELLETLVLAKDILASREKLMGITESLFNISEKSLQMAQVTQEKLIAINNILFPEPVKEKDNISTEHSVDINLMETIATISQEPTLPQETLTALSDILVRLNKARVLLQGGKNAAADRTTH